MAITKILYRNGGLAQAIQYITNPDKTDQCVLVDHFNCDPGFAYQQMMNTKRRFHKTDGRQCYHIIQSFKPDEITPELAHEIAKRFAAEHLRGYEAVIGTHVDKGHIHSHIVFNSVNADTGIKYTQYASKLLPTNSWNLGPALRRKWSIRNSSGRVYKNSQLY